MRRIPRQLAVPISLLTVCSIAGAIQGQIYARVQAIRFWSFGDVTRIAIQTEGSYRLSSDQIARPARAFFELAGLRPPVDAKAGFETILVNDRRVKQIRVAPVTGGSTRVIFDLEGPAQILSSQLVNPDRLIIEIRPKSTTSGLLAARGTARSSQRFDQVAALTPPVIKPIVSDAPAVTIPLKPVPPLPPPQTAPLSSDRSLVRVLGLKMTKVVIDAGHGGHDTGTIGPGGLLEKELVLDVALRLGALITKNLGAQVVYTRDSDVFIPLETRTHIADDEKADLFISIHANSSPEPFATGVETYYFNLTSDKAGLDLATRENAVSSSSISDLNDLLHRAVLQTKLEESREFAQSVQTSLWAQSIRMNVKSKNRGVRQAPFAVLIGATMPSILAEIGFVSNPHDEKLMRRGDQRQKIADALYKGIESYSRSLNRSELARAIPR